MVNVERGRADDYDGYENIAPAMPVEDAVLRASGTRGDPHRSAISEYLSKRVSAIAEADDPPLRMA